MKTSVKIIHWTPRIIVIIATLFVSMFALDSFTPERTFIQNLGAFFMHLIPSFVLIVLLIVAWKKELIGGILFTVAGLLLSPFIYLHNYRMNHSVATSLLVLLIITFPFIVAGILFIMSHYRRKNNHT